jgi:hypothetical protein
MIKLPRAGGRISWLSLVAVYSAGALLSSSLLGAVLGFVGAALAPWESPGTRLAVVGGMGAVLAAADAVSAASRGRCALSLPRQTRRQWWDLFGRRRAAFLWGFDLGLGFTTVRVGSLFWLVALAVIALGSAPAGAVVFAAYGIGVASNLVFGTVVLGRPERRYAGSHCGQEQAGLNALRLGRPLRFVLAAALAAWSTSLVGVGLWLLSSKPL